MGHPIVRHATLDDARGIAEAHVASWQSAYRGLIDQAALDALDVDQRETMWRGWITRALKGEPTDAAGSPSHEILIAELAGRVLGWASFGAGRDDDANGRGELAGLYAHPDGWGTGVGHALITEVEERPRAAGFDAAYLWVLQGNERASRFYERHGWHATGERKIEDMSGATALTELRHVRSL